MIIVGFDFGTTNSLISVINANRALNVTDREGLPVPSVVAYEGAETIAGRAAKERLDRAGLGVHGNIVRSPKSLLGYGTIFVGGVERSPVDVVYDVIAHVKEQALRSHVNVDLGGVTRAVVTIPVDWDGSRRAALRDAFRRAGIGIVQFIHEPFAALYGHFRSQHDVADALREYDRRYVIVVDWGGGTLDLTLCALNGGQITQLRNHGTADVGGDVFDEAIRNAVIDAYCTNHRLGTKVEAHADARTRLLHACERAKIDLSTRASAVLYVPSFFNAAPEDFDYVLERESLETMTQPIIRNGIRRISDLLNSVHVAPAQIALCLTSGGMVNMPAIRARLHELFGPQRVNISDNSSTLIAEGAAWVAYDQRPLHLGKTVELRLARNAYLSLVRAGTSMPGQGQMQQASFHLYCADPRDGAAKFEVCTPEGAGDDVQITAPRIALANLVVKVDEKARPFRERLELDVGIDDDLILKASARSLNQKDHATAEIHQLEFGISLPASVEPERGEGERRDPFDLPTTGHHSPGDLVVRSNVADEANDVLVPGELLYSYDPLYFDRRRNPPEEQVHERLYYRPCAICGRVSNDPHCRCLTTGSAGVGVG